MINPITRIILIKQLVLNYYSLIRVIESWGMKSHLSLEEYLTQLKIESGSLTNDEIYFAKHLVFSNIE